MTDKENVASYAIKYVKNGMRLGLGSGSTIAYFIKALAEKVKLEKLDLVIASSSNETTRLASELGLHVSELKDIAQLDLVIDGVDIVNSDLDGIKGGGAALFREKVLALMAQKNIWIVGNNKRDEKLSNFLLPIEVSTFALEFVLKQLANKLDLTEYQIRQKDNKFLITDNHNYIVDVNIQKYDGNYNYLAQQLDQITGILEHGLFLNICDHLIASEDLEIKEFIK